MKITRKKLLHLRDSKMYDLELYYAEPYKNLPIKEVGDDAIARHPFGKEKLNRMR